MEYKVIYNKAEVLQIVDKDAPIYTADNIITGELFNVKKMLDAIGIDTSLINAFEEPSTDELVYVIIPAELIPTLKEQAGLTFYEMLTSKAFDVVLKFEEITDITQTTSRVPAVFIKMVPVTLRQLDEGDADKVQGIIDFFNSQNDASRQINFKCLFANYAEFIEFRNANVIAV